jgi:predicted nucleic acid-binding protein
MTWVVDTCIVIDVLEDDPLFGLRSATLLQQRLDEGLSICPVTFVELSPAFDGDWEQQELFLEQAGIDFRTAWTTADTRTAHKACYSHITARRSGSLPKRPIADVLIGAYASNRRGLITRNPADFLQNFPDLAILEP